MKLIIEFPMNIISTYNGAGNLDITLDDNISYLIGKYFYDNNIDFKILELDIIESVPNINDKLIRYQVEIGVDSKDFKVDWIVKALADENLDKGLTIKTLDGTIIYIENTSQEKPIVGIWDSVGLGVIIKYPSGILISNQTGGLSCLRPKVEGIYFPISNDYDKTNKKFLSPEIELSNYFNAKYNGSGAVNGINQEDVAEIEVILKKWNLGDMFEVDLDNIKKSHEAWIFVLVKEEKRKHTKLIKGFVNYPLGGVLTWSNSD